MKRKKRRWTREELHTLRDLAAQGLPLKEIAKAFPYRTQDQVYSKLRATGFPWPRRRPGVWGRSGRERFREMWKAGATPEEIAKAFMISERAVAEHARKLGLVRRRVPWLEPEIAQVRRLVASGAPPKMIAKIMGRSPGSVRSLMRRLGLKRPRSVRPKIRPWSDEEVRRVVALRNKGMMISEICRATGRSKSSVRYALRLAGSSDRFGAKVTNRHKSPWTPEEDARLKAGYAKGEPIVKIAKMLGRHEEAIRRRAIKLGVHHPESPRRWTQGEDSILRVMVRAGAPVHEICATLRRSRVSIHRRMSALGLRMAGEWLPEEDEALLAMCQAGRHIAVIAAALGRTVAAVRHRKERLARRERAA